ncbi:MAG: response regulator transcription factor [Mariniphaga sp.]|nr:response regulator transcription factor [Mariniphaga sp.]
MQPSTCKIGLIENFTLISSSLKTELEAIDGYEVVATGKNVDDLTKQMNGDEPDIILIDVLNRHNAGINTVKDAKKTFPGVPLILITAREYSECFKDYIDFGAKGFVYADDSPDELNKAIQVICNGKEFFKEYVTKYWIDADSKTIKKNKRRKSKENPLSPREIEIIKLFCDGLTYREIADKLFISHRTVESHKNNIMKKLKLKSRAEMIKYATRNNYTTN